MIKYFSKIAFRYLWSNKTYSGLNIVCLTFGFVCAIIAALYIMNVFNYDKFHKNYNQLYSVESLVTYFNGDRFPKEYLSASLPDLLKERAPEIREVTRIASRNCSIVNGDKSFDVEGYYADNNFFEVFTFPLIHGNSKQTLTDVNSITLSEELAVKLFGNTNCVGKGILLKEDNIEKAFQVAGVYRKIPTQSILQFDFVIAFDRFLAENEWANEKAASSNLTWVLLNDNADVKNVNAKIEGLIREQEANLNQELFLFPLKDKLLYEYVGDKWVWREMQKVVIIGAIGFVILLIACFNFINLAIAVNIKRYREAGIKKVIGSRKSVIIYQFLGETFIIILTSLVCAIFLVNLTMNNINAVVNNAINFSLTDFRMIIFFISVVVLTAMASGLFPALYLASSNPIKVLKGNIASKNNFSLFRQSLIVFQFVIPIALIICMMIIRTQDSFMRKYDVGVDKDKLIILDNSAGIQKHFEAVKSELLSIPGIEAVSLTNCIPTRGTSVSNDVSWEGKDPTQKLHFWCVNTDFDYNKVVAIKMADGRFFDPSFAADSACYVINDIAAGVMKSKDPVGSSITLDGKKGTVIGVFKNFHAVDLAGPYAPVIIRIKPDETPVLLIRYSTGSYSSITGNIQKVYSHYSPEGPFHATLFRDLIPYSNLSMPSEIIGIAFVIALLLACMGLYGLASFNAESRTKEIGIRKTNGATTRSIMRLLLTNYIKWLSVSFLMALPLAFLLGKIFLSQFHFHTPMPFWAFLTGPMIAVIVALLTVSVKTYHVANRNPVEALRYE
jgi:ABC-type antimicrobial peptide transport system permease subunit